MITPFSFLKKKYNVTVPNFTFKKPITRLTVRFIVNNPTGFTGTENTMLTILNGLTDIVVNAVIRDTTNYSSYTGHNFTIISESTGTFDFSGLASETKPIITIGGEHWNDLKMGSNGDTSGTITEGNHNIVNNHPILNGISSPFPYSSNNGAWFFGRVTKSSNASPWCYLVRNDRYLKDANKYQIIAFDTGDILNDSSASPAPRVYIAGYQAEAWSNEVKQIFINSIYWVNELGPFSTKAQAFFNRVEADGGIIENKNFVAKQIDALDNTETLAFIAGAYKASKLYSAVPADGGGDVTTFVRSASKGRFNKIGKYEIVGNNIPTINFNATEPQRPSVNFGTNDIDTNQLLYSEPTTTQLSDSNITFESYDWKNGFTTCVKFGDNSVQRNYFDGSFSGITGRWILVSAFIIMDNGTEPVVGTNTTTGDFSLIGDNQIVTNTDSSRVERISSYLPIYRVSGAVQVGGTPSNIYGIEKYSGQTANGFRCTGFQVEEHSTITTSLERPTAYIRTSGSTASTDYDGVSGLVNGLRFSNLDSKNILKQSEGSLFVSGRIVGSSGTSIRVYASGGTTYMGLYFSGINSTLTDGIHSAINENINLGGWTINGADDAGWFRMVMVWNSTSVKFYSPTTMVKEYDNTVFTVITPSYINLPVGTKGNVDFFEVKAWDRALSATEALALTSVSTDQESIVDTFVSRVYADGGVVENIDNLNEKVKTFDGSETLVLIPSGYKTNTLYSIIPSGSTGDFTGVTRSSVGTRINELGSIEKETNNTPRFNYDFKGEPSLKLEENRTNIQFYSHDLNNWTKASCSAVLSTTELIPRLNKYAWEVEITTPTFNNIYQTASDAVSGTTYTLSFYVKTDTILNRITLRHSNDNATTLWLTLHNPAPINVTIEDLGSGWYFVTRTFTSTLTTQVDFYLGATSSYGGEIGDKWYFGGFQLEATSGATSYIETSGSSVTRAKDLIANITNAASLINSQEGVLYLDSKVRMNTAYQRIVLTDTTASASTTMSFIFRNGALNITGQIDGSYTIGCDYNYGVANETFLDTRIAFGWRENDFTLAVDGAIVDRDPTGSVSGVTFDRININNLIGYLDWEIKDFRLMGTGWTDSKLKALTTKQSDLPLIKSTTTAILTHNVSPSSEIVINKPTGTINNDLILIVVSSDIIGTSESAWDETFKPIGFTIVTQTPFETAPDVRVGVFYKVVDGTEGNTFTIPLNKITSTYGATAFCARISGVNVNNPIDQIGTWATSRHTISGVTTTEINTLAIYVVGGDGGNTSPYAEPTGWTEVADFASDIGSVLGSGMAVGTKEIITAGTTGDVIATNSNNDGFSGVQFNIRSK